MLRGVVDRLPTQRVPESAHRWIVPCKVQQKRPNMQSRSHQIDKFQAFVKADSCACRQSEGSWERHAAHSRELDSRGGWTSGGRHCRHSPRLQRESCCSFLQAKHAHCYCFLRVQWTAGRGTLGDVEVQEEVQIDGNCSHRSWTVAGGWLALASGFDACATPNSTAPSFAFLVRSWCDSYSAA